MPTPDIDNIISDQSLWVTHRSKSIYKVAVWAKNKTEKTNNKQNKCTMQQSGVNFEVGD
jgi:hypothetical protein